MAGCHVGAMEARAICHTASALDLCDLSLDVLAVRARAWRAAMARRLSSHVDHVPRTCER